MYTLLFVCVCVFKHNNIEPLTLDDIETRPPHIQIPLHNAIGKPCTQCFDTWSHNIVLYYKNMNVGTYIMLCICLCMV